MIFRPDKSAKRPIRGVLFSSFGVFFLVSTLLLHAGNLWESKPVAQWTFEEISDFLEDSPWTRIVNVSSTYHMQYVRDPIGPKMETQRRTKYNPITGEVVVYYVYVEVDRPPVRRAKRFSYKIIWLSSRLVQEALVEQARKGPTYLSWWWGPRADLQVPDPSEHIVLLLVGPMLEKLEGSAPGDPSTEFYLRTPGSKRKIPVQSIRYIGGRGAALLTFPRELSGEEKHITLHCEFRRLKFKKKFDLRRMGLMGSPDI